MWRRDFTAWALAAAVAALVSACGGDDRAEDRGNRPQTTAAAVRSGSTAAAALVPAAYRAWALERAARAEAGADALRAATRRRDLEDARRAYARTLVAYEAMRPAGEAFADEDRAIAAPRDEVAGAWTGLRPLEGALFGDASWSRRDRLARGLRADLGALRDRLPDLALSGRDQVRAASHLLSDIEAYDLARRSEQRSGLARRVALARVDGAAALWRAVAEPVRLARPRAGAAVDRELRALRRALRRPSDSIALGQRVDRAANAVAATAGVFS